jgi:hypothetical protein
MKQTQLEFDIHRAADNANRNFPNWTDQARQFLIWFLGKYPHQKFSAKDVRELAYQTNMVPHPPHERAWGFVMRQASRDGLIVRNGTVPAKYGSANPTTIQAWKSNLK